MVIPFVLFPAGHSVCSMAPYYYSQLFAASERSAESTPIKRKAEDRSKICMSVKDTTKSESNNAKEPDSLTHQNYE